MHILNCNQFFCIPHLSVLKVIIYSEWPNEANITLNAVNYALDVGTFEVLTLMWVGRERGMRQGRSVGGGWIEVNIHGAPQSFLGLTRRMAEIRKNGRLQVLPSAIKTALFSLISYTLPFFFYVPTWHPPLFLSLVFFLFLTRAHSVSLTLSCSNSLSGSLPLSVLLPPSLSYPLLQPVKSLCFSSPVLLLQTVFIWPHHIWWDR